MGEIKTLISLAQQYSYYCGGSIEPPHSTLMLLLFICELVLCSRMVTG